MEFLNISWFLLQPQKLYASLIWDLVSNTLVPLWLKEEKVTCISTPSHPCLHPSCIRQQINDIMKNKLKINPLPIFYEACVARSPPRQRCFCFLIADQIGDLIRFDSPSSSSRAFLIACHLISSVKHALQTKRRPVKASENLRTVLQYKPLFCTHIGFTKSSPICNFFHFRSSQAHRTLSFFNRMRQKPKPR